MYYHIHGDYNDSNNGKENTDKVQKMRTRVREVTATKVIMEVCKNNS